MIIVIKVPCKSNDIDSYNLLFDKAMFPLPIH